MTASRSASAPAVRRAARATVCAALLGSVVGGVLLWLAPPVPDGADVNLRPMLGLTYTVVGAVIVTRMPRNPIGWILLSGVTLSVSAAGLGYAAYGSGLGWPTVGPAEWISAATETPTLHLLVGCALLLFPDGARTAWRRALVRLGTMGAALFWLGTVLGSGTSRFASQGVVVPVPVGWDGADVLFVGIFGVLVSAIGGLFAVVTGFHRSVGAERKQHAWLLFGGAVSIGGLVAVALADSWIDRVAQLVATTSVPIALAVAILRYRLYDIERVIRRTGAYAVVTAVLVGLYALVVLVPTAAVGTADAPDLLVAAATLATAAVARPLYLRMQSLIDQRFARERFDAQETIAVFGSRLRDEVALGRLSDELGRVVRATVAPVHQSLWLREVRS